MTTDRDVQNYLSDHPGATVTEIAFATGLSIPEVRVAMAGQNAPQPSETTRNATQVSELTDLPSDSETAVLGHSSRGVRQVARTLDARWLDKTLRTAGVMDLHDAAQYLQIARPSIEMAVAKGALPHVRIGSTERGKKLFTKVDLDAYRAKHPRAHYPKGKATA